MNSSNFRFILDTHKTQSQISIPILTGDTGKKLFIGLSDGQEPYVIEDGCIANFVGKKPDGTSLIHSCAIENNKTIVYEFTGNTASVAGITKCEIRLYGADGKLITSPRFILVVDERVVTDEDLEVPEDDLTAIDNIFLVEANRVAAESARDEAELARVTTENDRITAETLRVAAEEKRVTAEEARENAIATAFEKAMTTYIGFQGSVVLLASDWVNGAQSVTIPNVATNDFIMFFPASQADNNNIATNKIYCNSEAVEGVVVFTADTTPVADISLMYYVNRRGEG